MTAPTTLSADDLALIDRFSLSQGAHSSLEEGACALELISYVTREPWSDHPACVCPVLGAFFRAWNDSLPDADRNAIIKPLLPRLIGTNGGSALAERRASMAADWLIRIHTPAWLRLAKLDAQANALASLPEITSVASIPSIREPIEAASNDAAAARDAAWAAAGDAARAAAWAAARAAAWAAAWDAAWAAAGAAAWDAAGDALKPTRDLLIQSAAELVERMINARVA